MLVFPKRVLRSPPGVFSEVVGGELGGLAEEGAELELKCCDELLLV